VVSQPTINAAVLTTEAAAPKSRRSLARDPTSEALPAGAAAVDDAPQNGHAGSVPLVCREHPAQRRNDMG